MLEWHIQLTIGDSLPVAADGHAWFLFVQQYACYSEVVEPGAQPRQEYLPALADIHRVRESRAGSRRGHAVMFTLSHCLCVAKMRSN